MSEGQVVSRINQLVENYKRHIALPWQKGLAGAQRAVFVVYEMNDERRLRCRQALFEMATHDAGHGWADVDLTGAFAEWMAGRLRRHTRIFHHFSSQRSRQRGTGFPLLSDAKPGQCSERRSGNLYVGLQQSDEYQRIAGTHFQHRVALH